MKNYLFLFLVLGLTAHSQNGKIIAQVAFTLPDTSITKIEKDVPSIKATLAAVNFYHITYLSDGLKVKGYLAVPKKDGKYPCIIYNRGGNLEFGKITDEGFVVRGLGELCNNGYIIAASQYRGNEGGEGKEEFGGIEVNDVLNLIPLFSNVPKADASRIGMFGWSRGGMMTYLALSKTTKIKAAVVGSGIVDLESLLKTRPGMEEVYTNLIPDYTKNKATAIKERSVVHFADQINKTTPILILQGTSDWRVPTDQVLDLVNKFYKLKQPFRFTLYEGGEHSLQEHRADYVSQMTNWFNTYLRDGRPWPSLEVHGD